MTERHLCFAYGSLMRGMGNHRALQGAALVRIALTAPSFTLHDLGSFPGMVEGGATRVHGELYELDDKTLAALDRLEGHPVFYRRHEITLSDGARADAYLLPAAGYSRFPVVVGGDWRAHAPQGRTSADPRGSPRSLNARRQT